MPNPQSPSNPGPGPEPSTLRQQRLIAQAEDLVTDRAVRCELCRQRMRYCPVGAKTVQRAAGRYFSWRCDGCFFATQVVAAVLTGHALSPIQIQQGRLAQAQALSDHLEELQNEPPTPLFTAALDQLCRQLQAVAEQLDAITAALTQARGIVLYVAPELADPEPTTRHLPWTAHPPTPAQA